MREHWILAALEDDHRVVVHHAFAITGEPVAEHACVNTLRQVTHRGDEVTRPGLREVEAALGQIGVAGDRHPWLGELVHLKHGITGGIEERIVAGVDLGASVAEQGHLDDLAVVVEHC